MSQDNYNRNTATVNTTQLYDTDLRALLECVLPALEQHETIECRFLLAGQRPERRFYQGVLFAAQDVQRQWRERANCYFGVCLRRGHGGSAADVSRAGSLWCDVDQKLWPDLPDPAAAALGAVADFPWRPSALVMSGGGLQPYWRLREPYHVATDGKERLERVNAALARAVVGQGRTPDHTQDVARIFRLPGTLNRKYTPPVPVQLVWCEPERTYDLDDLEAGLGVLYPWAVRAVQPQRAPAEIDWSQRLSGVAGLRERVARGRIRRLTLDLLDSSGPAGYQSASEADAALAAGLVGAGLSAGEACALMQSSTRGVDALRRKGERHGTNYLRATCARAASFVGPVSAIPNALHEHQRARSADALLRTRLARV